MKFVFTILVTATLFGCSQLPTAPASPALTSVVATVVDESGGCIVGATLQVVGGQGLGQTITQITPCSIYDYPGAAHFRDLTSGVPMTVRASAPGYTAQEKTIIPGRDSAVLFSPARIQ